jgi:hypothetical protein
MALFIISFKLYASLNIFFNLNVTMFDIKFRSSLFKIKINLNKKPMNQFSKLAIKTIKNGRVLLEIRSHRVQAID